MVMHEIFDLVSCKCKEGSVQKILIVQGYLRSSAAATVIHLRLNAEIFNKRVDTARHGYCNAYKPDQLIEPPFVRLSVFDQVTDDTHFAAVFAFRPPNPPNPRWASSLGDILTKFPEWAGRFGEDTDGNPGIIMDGTGVPFLEATMYSSQSDPSPVLLQLHPSTYGVDELAQVQLTHFSCGTLAVGVTFHHKLGDGHATTQFLVSWARVCRGQNVHARTVYDRHVLFPSRNPPKIQFEHRGVEYKVKGTTVSSGHQPTHETVVHKAHFSKEFLNKIKEQAGPQYSTFVCLMAHLWRSVTKARGLDEDIRLHIAVDGRSRLNEKLPKDYLGNVVLWAFCRSFIDFANSKDVKEEGLEPVTELTIQVLYPDMDVYSWLRFPFHALDFGCGAPFCFLPTYMPLEGLSGRDVDAYMSLFEHNVDAFKQLCFSLDDEMEMLRNCHEENISQIY
ncbi:hypothetical protein LUZ60_005807 [Juncus effusus]|nr:hypothetical protein LUZ60_005807 [Juncus effusus]